MTEYALPITPISDAKVGLIINKLNEYLSEVDRSDYYFSGELGYHVYVWFEAETPIYVGVGAPSKPKRYVEHWTKAGSEGMEYSIYLAAHRATIWPALAASNLNSAVAHTLERLLIRKYRRRVDGGSLWNKSFGKNIGRETRGEDTFGLRRTAERAKFEERYLNRFQLSNRPHACWQTAKIEGVSIHDDVELRLLINHNPKANGNHEFQFSLYKGVSTVGDYRSVYMQARLKGAPKGQALERDVDSHLFWDCCCQHPEGLRIPRQSGRGFRFEVGHRSDLIPATIPI